MTSFDSVEGEGVIWRIRTVHGPFCRDCGSTTSLRMTRATLADGWWSMASFVVTPAILFTNRRHRRKVIRLPAPEPPAYGPWRRPMDPRSVDLGRPFLSRKEILVILLAISAPVLIVAVLYAVSPHHGP